MKLGIEILDLEKRNNKLKITVKLELNSEAGIRSPKIMINFTQCDKNRRMPMIIDSIQDGETIDSHQIYASYVYDLKALFYNQINLEDPIEISFSFRYEDFNFEQVPITISHGIAEKIEELHIQQNRENSILIDNPYEDIKDGRQVVKSFMIKKILSTVYKIILFSFAICLLPLFCVDAVMTKVGLSKGAARNKSTGLKWFLVHVKWRFCSFVKQDIRVIDFKLGYLKRNYKKYQKKTVNKNRITFLSSRRDDLTGNLADVYYELKQEGLYELETFLDHRDFVNIPFKQIKRLAFLCATSKVILIDDFTPILNHMELKEETKLVQLWHACGAFKTFGFSRLGKKGGPKQTSKNHRNYDVAIVSSKEIAKFYAEGFGVGDQNIKATGIPRTDIFFDQAYKQKIQDEFYAKYPKLKNKKIILFAPTFRGNGKKSAYYPISRFDPNKVFEDLQGEYAIIMKYHPFINNKVEIEEKNQDYILDLSENSEINDLLFITDLLITDYSSVVFEASLLNLPILFYAYDLNEYIAKRDFYYDYKTFVPGKIVYEEEEVIECIKRHDYDKEKLNAFKEKFFDHLDGKSTERVANMVKELVEN